jgi:hypothetical protein
MAANEERRNDGRIDVWLIGSIRDDRLRPILLKNSIFADDVKMRALQARAL